MMTRCYPTVTVKNAASGSNPQDFTSQKMLYLAVKIQTQHYNSSSTKYPIGSHVTVRKLIESQAAWPIVFKKKNSLNEAPIMTHGLNTTLKFFCDPLKCADGSNCLQLVVNSQ